MDGTVADFRLDWVVCARLTAVVLGTVERSIHHASTSFCHDNLQHKPTAYD